MRVYRVHCRDQPEPVSPPTLFVERLTDTADVSVADTDRQGPRAGESDGTSIGVLGFQSSGIDAIQTVDINDNNRADGKRLYTAYLAELVFPSVTIECKGGQLVLPSDDPKLLETCIAPYCS